MKIIAIIPSRYASQRFPGKPLVDIAGKSMIQRTYEQVRSVGVFERVMVATDDDRIYQHVKSFGGEVMMTSDQHLSGTDRCGEVVARLEQDFDYVINVQGDEPFVQKDQLIVLIDLLKTKPAIATLIKKIEDIDLIDDINKPKVVVDKHGNALYFSRYPIPFQRNPSTKIQYYHHIGVYAFKKEVLLELVKLEPSDLERAESLEQLRWLENGYPIKTGITDRESFGIDHPEDLEKLKQKGLIE